MDTQLEVAQAKKIERLKQQILKFEHVLHAQNIKLDALHWVWCSGGCQGGTNRWVPGELTEEMLKTAEYAVKRMTESYNTLEYRKRAAQCRAAEQENQGE